MNPRVGYWKIFQLLNLANCQGDFVKVFFVVFILSSLLTGCSTGSFSVGGNNDKLKRDYVEQHLIEGKSTKADVRRDFGEPPKGNITYNSDKEEVWSYPADSGFNLADAAASIITGVLASEAARVANSQNNFEAVNFIHREKLRTVCHHQSCRQRIKHLEQRQ
ncbi:lipoprotein [Klebsiella pneumoniae]|nr:lipoprotein [Klebsiella pneumoniae]